MSYQAIGNKLIVKNLNDMHDVVSLNIITINVSKKYIYE